MKRNYFQVRLAIRFPSDAGKRLDFTNRLPQIQEAADSFNQYYDRSDRPADNIREMCMKILRVNKDSIDLMYYVGMHDGWENWPASGRDMSLFSKRLYHDSGWKEFSKVNTKLFKLAEGPTPITEEQYLAAEPMTFSTYNFQDAVSDLPSDEEALQAFQSLLATQSFGTAFSRQKKQKALLQIKQILLDNV